jgi:SH3-like domain-containing protein
MHECSGLIRRPVAPHHRLAVACLLGLLLAPGAGPAARAQTIKEKTPAAKTAPEEDAEVLRYLSLKSDRVVLFKGPGKQHAVAGELRRAGLPVEVLREQGAWREVRDAGGTTGWMHASLLSGRRTALILPWEVKEGQAHAPVVTLRDGGHEQARAVAQVEAGVLVSIISCARHWCRVSTGDHRGYIEQGSLWGTYLGEEIR